MRNTNATIPHSLFHLGWREWASFPELGIASIKAKIDTGARTSALHTAYIEDFVREGREYVRFGVHPFQKNSEILIESESPVVDRRSIKDSGGHAEMRPIIRTEVRVGSYIKSIELSLTNREKMAFRLLIGRTALSIGTVIHPTLSFLHGRRA